MDGPSFSAIAGYDTALMPLDDHERRMCSEVAGREAVMRAQLAEHVAIPTGWNYAPGLNAYRQLLTDRLEALGAMIELVSGAARPTWLEFAPSVPERPGNAPPTLTAEYRGGGDGPRILIAGHLDTVHDPQGPFQKLTVNPGDQTAAGPGAADMKGGIVIALNALEALRVCGVKLNWTFLLNSDEETGSFHSMEAIARIAAEHDVGIALEPALPDGSLVVERMGSGQFKVEVFGRAAHVGRDFARGVSAVDKLAEIIVKLASLSDPQRGLIVNVGPLQGGTATNVVPDYAACWGNFRFSDEGSARLIEGQLEGLAIRDDELPRVAVQRLINRPAKAFTDEVKRLAEVARETSSDLGQQLTFGKTGGVCDGNIMQAAGLPTIDTLGVRGGNLHRPDEFIELPSLVERCQLLAVVLARCGAGQR